MDDALRKALENHYSVLMREALRIKALLDDDTRRRSTTMTPAPTVQARTVSSVIDTDR